MILRTINVFVLTGVILFSACNKDEAAVTPITSNGTTNPNCGNVNISTSGSTASHNFGQNCMGCHSSAGNGDGCFLAAGSVSNSALTAPLNAGTVKFYSAPNGGGTLISTLQIDGKGNFHTTQSTNLIGSYPVITGSDGVPHFMGSSLNSGACNSCHGSSTTKLWAN